MFEKRLPYVWIYAFALLLILLSVLAQITVSVNEQQKQLSLRADAAQTQLAKVLPAFVAYYDTDSIQRIVEASLSNELNTIALTDLVTAEKVEWSSPETSLNIYWFEAVMGIQPVKRTFPLIHEGSDVASLTLTFSPHAASQVVAREASQFSLILGVAVVMLLSAFTVMFKRSKRAIKRVTRTLDSLSEQDFTSPQAKQRSGVKSLDMALDNLANHIQRIIQSLHRELKTLNNSLMYDPVSGLPNRQYFTHQLGSWMTEEEGVPGAVFIADMSWMDIIYRRYGYVARDETWQLLAGSLQSAFRAHPNVCIARLSDTEIALILPQSSEEQCQQGLHTLISTLNNEVTMAGFNTNEGFHIGVVHGHGLPGTQLLSLADNALQRAIKQHDVFVFNRASEEQVIGRETWRSLLNDALKHKAIRLLAQPVYPLSGNKGVALHREIFTQANIEGSWQSGGRLMPYIQLFKKGIEFDRVVIEHLVGLHKASPITETVALNLTNDSLESHEFLSWLQTLLTTILPADKICFEISEASACNNLSACIAFSEGIRKAGATIGIDHFGRYLQEVEYLTVLKPDYVKLDHAFSQDQNAQSRLFIDMLANIAESQGITVIATGVKDEESKAKINIDVINAYQGFIHPPCVLPQQEQTT
ncbi:EAL domain-containing protein [Grimontia hollisae]|uniref:EAL domain-containing protein n=1 Tax=Grimontia hollisae TaxID=673 RepID=UPI00165E0BFF|nr:EAL domain-containing protein [Grimontia hollisae]